eukprot:CAMPEP_0113904506 /NCGR_PEP_ID=MMETSP0780_2-20120614/23302_1 /TAXON_ID=652834 /ORGANISM="Palpitomonas bilix" /LENGTH=35 /DNA_ID=CAMNT_0000898147 /DNA_START=323 /DNA_END=427 /DNA_ORIENTATION=+ /assembly_acc=CAM_ASM_000599
MADAEEASSVASILMGFATTLLSCVEQRVSSREGK